MPQNAGDATRHCNNTMQQGTATTRCNKALQQHDATRHCNNTMQQGTTTTRCNKALQQHTRKRRRHMSACLQMQQAPSAGGGSAKCLMSMFILILKKPFCWRGLQNAGFGCGVHSSTPFSGSSVPDNHRIPVFVQPVPENMRPEMCIGMEIGTEIRIRKLSF